MKLYGIRNKKKSKEVIDTKEDCDKKQSAKQKSHSEFDKRIDDYFIVNEQKKIKDQYDADKLQIKAEIRRKTGLYAEELVAYQRKLEQELADYKQSVQQDLEDYKDKCMKELTKIKREQKKRLKEGFEYQKSQLLPESYPYHRTDVSSPHYIYAGSQY